MMLAVIITWSSFMMSFTSTLLLHSQYKTSEQPDHFFEYRNESSGFSTVLFVVLVVMQALNLQHRHFGKLTT